MRSAPQIADWVRACEDSSERANRKHRAGHGVPPLWVRAVIVLVAAVAVLGLIVALGLVFGGVSR